MKTKAAIVCLLFIGIAVSAIRWIDWEYVELDVACSEAGDSFTVYDFSNERPKRRLANFENVDALVRWLQENAEDLSVDKVRLHAESQVDDHTGSIVVSELLSLDDRRFAVSITYPTSGLEKMQEGVVAEKPSGRFFRFLGIDRP